MKRTTLIRGAAVVFTAAALSAAVAVSTGAYASTAPATAKHTSGPKPTIVLVHGAWADGSSWSGVTDRLEAAGYTVDVFANPLRGVQSDSTVLATFLEHITGPIVLAGHSYGGMVITNAASGNANVKALVYVDAFIPRQGDTVNALTSESPGSALADQSVIDPITFADKTGADLYIKQAAFPAIFAGGVPARTAARLAAGQRPLSYSSLTEASPSVPAWKTISSWAVIGTGDKLIPPAEQALMASRAGAKVVKVKDAPHLSMVSNPDAVTAVIGTAVYATR
ncbi:pimeloyl-ACP methyl ester carboxylesterase [Actinoplanes tereljensis]|uniref:Alpha/beta hydrolase n=1 Tax=Paractinoplanes tereljensis TaxID=571912 RepID=A0A919NQN9_9ACTN|nr:alpha/beta hydrolase [Actinoplanes tereljensis]GIF23290.1 alpha/beta hydrolase [Actinoplanes tereljensis]